MNLVFTIYGMKFILPVFTNEPPQEEVISLKGENYFGLRLLAVDEIAAHKGHNYFTVVMDLERTRVVWVGKGRKQETLDQFFKELGAERSGQIEAPGLALPEPVI